MSNSGVMTKKTFFKQISVNIDFFKAFFSAFDTFQRKSSAHKIFFRKKTFGFEKEEVHRGLEVKFLILPMRILSTTTKFLPQFIFWTFTELLILAFKNNIIL